MYTSSTKFMKLLKVYFVFIYMYVCIFVYVHGGIQMTEVDAYSLGNGITGGCELLDTGAVNPILVL